jgi:hypothetical protein
MRCASNRFILKGTSTIKSPSVRLECMIEVHQHTCKKMLYHTVATVICVSKRPEQKLSYSSSPRTESRHRAPNCCANHGHSGTYLRYLVLLYIVYAPDSMASLRNDEAQSFRQQQLQFVWVPGCDFEPPSKPIYFIPGDCNTVNLNQGQFFTSRCDSYSNLESFAKAMVLSTL